MERKLYEAAVEGSVVSLLNLLHGDALLLDRFITGCYPETPLHIASMLGHAEFVEEIVTRKPELAEELDLRRSSPLHLATGKGHLNIVKRLLQVNADMCFVCDRDGRNPLHIAAIKGRMNILRVLVQTRRKAARMLIDGEETILHACVRYNQLEALKYLLGTITDHKFVNFRNSEDNTILHLAAADKQIEVVNFLIATSTVEVNSLNADGFVPMDLLLQEERDSKFKAISRSLLCVGAVRSKDTYLSKHKLKDVRTKILSPPTCYQMNASYSKYKVSKNINGKSHDDDWLEKKRSSLMVVASLLATMAFQAGVNPSGGIWQDDFQGDSTSNPHKAGGSIMADTNPSLYNYFLAHNTAGFMSSISIVLFLMSGLPLKRRFVVWIFMMIMWAALYAMSMSYLLSVYRPTPFYDTVPFKVTTGSYYVWICLVLLLLVGRIIRSIIKMI
ncbi:ankyrin repeat-containing protein At2g01680-like [Durio zibethinus]|uniref:Ankyrin repeat-containing protein At2g01680-like n=1 Tax=Durio zibethinus TaxID=66656 RepID=A0A6P5ZNP3_DURZI|nr:ankyrin repeat-containing protein At2g01680-like [Durio zibethinus]